MKNTGARRAVVLITLWGASVSLAPALQAAEYRVVPSLGLSEEFNDNLFETQTGKRSEFVTRVLPSVAFTSQGGGLAWDLSYGLDYRYFARDSVEDELTHRAALNAKLSFLNGFLRLDAGDSFSRVSLDVARDVVRESLVVSQSDQNVAFISPYLNWHLAENCSLKTGYRYNDIRYWDSPGVDQQEHDGFAELNYELTSRLTMSAGYTFVYATSEPTSYRRHDAFAGLRYDHGGGTTLFGSLGNSWQSFSNGVRTSNPFWSAGASKDFGILAATLSTQVQYTEDPLTLSTRETSYNAALSRVWTRGVASVTGSLVEYEVNQLAQVERRRKQAVVANGRYQLNEQLALTLSLSGDHLNQREAIDYPYHLYGNAGFEYVLNKHATLGANYTRVSYRRELDRSEGSVQVNRAIVEMRFYL